MRARSFAFLGLVILALLIIPLVFSSVDSPFMVSGSGVLSATTSSSGSYTENLSLYLTSSETFWKIDLAGGNISLSSVSVPSSVSGFSIALISYSTWKPQFEIFTQHGFGLLGPSEPFPSGALLVMNTTSQSDATQLANSLAQQFGLAFVQLSSSPNGFTFYSPMTFSTELSTYFWNLVPTSAGGFAALLTQSQLESADLGYFKLNYASGTPSYSISYGGLTPLQSTSFKLYTQLGLSQSTSYNYSSVAQNSTINIKVLGGLISNASVPFTNNYSNLSATMATSSKTGNGSMIIPNIGATLDFSFPTIVAYRQVTPTLTPTRSTNVSVLIFVRNVSPTGTPNANNVHVNDTWIYSQKNDFQLTVGQTGKEENLSSGAIMTVAYAFTVLSSNGTFTLPAAPVTYQFSSAGNKTETATAFLNPETLQIGATNTPQLESTASISSGTIQAGQSFSVNVTVVNKGSGTAFNVRSSGLTDPNPLPQGTTWSFLSNTSSTALTKTNATVSYGVSWKDSSGSLRNTTTNTISAVFSFGSPGTPGMYLEKFVNLSNSSSTSANVTLILFNNSPSSLKNLTINDPLPSEISFASGFNSSSIRSSNNNVNINVSSIAANANESFVYSVNIGNPKENYVILPASVTASWNNVTITHYSPGVGLPLGVASTKTVSPPVGFKGTGVQVLIGLTNQGSLPIYHVSLNNTFDPFLNVTSSKSAFQAILNPSGQMNATLTADLIGSQGAYNTSAASANFIFAGTTHTALSKPYLVTVYSLPSAQLSYSALKLEESHDIVITVNVTNPANVTINQVVYGVSIPKGLTVKQGNTNFTLPSLGPGGHYFNNFTIITSQPNVYEIPNGTLTFSYQGHELSGVANTFTLNIGDDLILRYGIWIVVGLIAVILAVFYVRRLSSPK